jgi:hypothetical protein
VERAPSTSPTRREPATLGHWARVACDAFLALEEVSRGLPSGPELQAIPSAEERFERLAVAVDSASERLGGAVAALASISPPPEAAYYHENITLLLDDIADAARVYSRRLEVRGEEDAWAAQEYASAWRAAGAALPADAFDSHTASAAVGAAGCENRE